MAVTAEQVADALRKLLPRGSAYAGALAGELRKLLLGFSEEFVRVRERMAALIVESDPRQTTELLPDWEAEFDLPSKCITVPQTEAERRAAIVGKLVNAGGQSVQFFIDQAAALGFTVTIEEAHGFRLGLDGMGDGVGGTDWNFVWYLHAEESVSQYLIVDGGAVGDQLVEWGSEMPECVINALKPAHTHAIFTYQEPA